MDIMDMVENTMCTWPVSDIYIYKAQHAHPPFLRCGKADQVPGLATIG